MSRFAQGAVAIVLLVHALASGRALVRDRVATLLPGHAPPRTGDPAFDEALARASRELPRDARVTFLGLGELGDFRDGVRHFQAAYALAPRPVVRAGFAPSAGPLDHHVPVPADPAGLARALEGRWVLVTAPDDRVAALGSPSWTDPSGLRLHRAR